MAEDGIYRRAQVPVKVIRGRGCNESFRAAVDRSYEAPSHHVMESGEIVDILLLPILFLT